MLKFFVKRPVTTIMFVLLFVVLGFVSYPKMNVERTPALDFPMVTPGPRIEKTYIPGV